jgi:hypothetical protein
MALQINTGLTTQDGGSVESGAYLIFSTRFPYRGLSYSIDMKIYRSLAALDAGYTSIRVVEIPDEFFSEQLTEQEFMGLTPIVIHERVKTYLETFVGEDNIEIIL